MATPPFDIKNILRSVGQSAIAGSTNEWTDFQGEIESLVADYLSGDPAKEIAARERINAIEAGLGEEQGKLAKEFFETSALNSIRPSLANEQEVKAAKAAINSSLALAGVKTAAGIWQVLDAKFKEEGLDPPRVPEALSKNKILSTRLAEAQARETMPDRAISADFERQLAELQATGNARARSTGNIGQYQGNLQANRLRSDNALLQFAADSERRNAMERRETNQLLNQSIAEDRYRQNELWKGFNVENDRFNTSLRNLQAQRTSGLNNMFIGLDELASGYAQSQGLPQTPQYNAMQVALLGAPSNRQRMIDKYAGDMGNTEAYVDPTMYPERQFDNPWEFSVDELDNLSKFDPMKYSGFPF